MTIDIIAAANTRLENHQRQQTVDQEPSTVGSGGVHDGLPVHPATEPQPLPPAVQEEPAAPLAGSELKQPTQYERVLAALREKPAMRAAEVAKAAGVPHGTASGYLSRARRQLEREEAGKAAESRKATPVVKVDPTPAPAPKAEPSATAGDPDDCDEPLPAPVKRIAAHPPAGTKFRLVDRASGNWLHQSLTMIGGRLALTMSRDYAWTGTERLMANVRKLHPETIDMREEVIL